MAPPGNSLDVASGKRYGYFAFLATLASTVLLALMIVGFVSTESAAGCDRTSLQSMNLVCIREFWSNHHRLLPLTFSFQIVGSLAAFTLLPPVLVVNEIYRRAGRPSQVMVPCIAAASGVRIMELVFGAGTSMHSDWMANTWSLADQDLKSLTISYLTVQSQGTWLFAMDYLFLGMGMIAASLLAYKCQDTMPRWWAHLGMVAGVIGIINFLVELARLGMWYRMGEIGFILMALDGFILLPIWIIGMSCALYKASASTSQPLMPAAGDDEVGTSQHLEMTDTRA